MHLYFLLLDLSIVSTLPLGHQSAFHLETNASEMAVGKGNPEATVQHVLYIPTFSSSLICTCYLYKTQHHSYRLASPQVQGDVKAFRKAV